MRLGLISYINSLPVTMALEVGAVGEGTTLVKAPPAELNRMALAGDLDLTAVSSVVYLKHRDQLRKIPGLCIASDGPVQSVRLFSRVPLEELGPGPVWMTGESETSRALLLQLFPKLRPLDRPGVPHLGAEAPAALRIGDAALKEVEGGEFVFDLGELWKERTGLPMVYAVWVTPTGKVDQSRDLLEKSLTWGREHREEVLDEARRRTGFSKQRLEEYYHSLHFRMDQRARRGLEEFAKGESHCLKL